MITQKDMTPGARTLIRKANKAGTDWRSLWRALCQHRAVEAERMIELLKRGQDYVLTCLDCGAEVSRTPAAKLFEAFEQDKDGKPVSCLSCGSFFPKGKFEKTEDGLECNSCAWGDDL